MRNLPHVPFPFIQTKTDIIQHTFYDMIAGPLWDEKSGAFHSAEDLGVSSAKFYDLVNELFSEYNKHNNFLAYMIDGDHHTTLRDFMFTTNALGMNETKGKSDSPT